jgi:hypothetical protein
VRLAAHENLAGALRLDTLFDRHLLVRLSYTVAHHPRRGASGGGAGRRVFPGVEDHSLMQPLFRRLGLAGDEIEQSRIAAAQIFVRSSQIDIQRSDRSERSQRDDREWEAGRDRLDRNRSFYSLSGSPAAFAISSARRADFIGPQPDHVIHRHASETDLVLTQYLYAVVSDSDPGNSARTPRPSAMAPKGSV